MAISWLQPYYACHVSKSTPKAPLKQDEDYLDFQHHNYLPLSHEKHRYKFWDWLKVGFSFSNPNPRLSNENMIYQVKKQTNKQTKTPILRFIPIRLLKSYP